LSDERVQLGARGRRFAARRCQVVLAVRQHELRLGEIGLGDVAGLDARLRGIACTRRKPADVVGDLNAKIRADDFEVGAPDIVADLGDDTGEIGFTDSDGRIGKVDPPIALAAELERQRRGNRLARRFLRELIGELRIRPLRCDGHAGDVDRPLQPGGGNRRIRGECTFDGRRKRQSRALRRLGPGGNGGGDRQNGDCPADRPALPRSAMSKHAGQGLLHPVDEHME
jgi:hypothetical protein